VAIKEDITISGTVVANDKYDEITHRIVVADNSGGIEIAIDSENIDVIFPLFSNVDVSVSGLYIGRQGGKCVLGKKPTGEYAVDRIKERELELYIRPNKDIATLEATKMRIADIGTEHMLHYIYLNDVRFIDEESGLSWCDCDKFGQRINTIRHLTDGVDTLRVICSKECTYAASELPHGERICYGIVDYAEGDIALRITNNYIIKRPY
jgi:hypothetical protein